MNLIVYFCAYFLILSSIIGYGYLFSSLCNFTLSKKYNLNNYLDISYIGIFGFFFLILYSYFSSFFLSHSKEHNVIFIFFGIINFIFFLITNKKKLNYLFLPLLIFIILFISALITKNHDDFFYYHFSYSYFLTQSPTVFGMGIFNHGFRTPSSLFYINSLFYLPVVNYYLFHFASIFILGFANIALAGNIINSIKDKDYNFISYLSLLFIVFINIFFYRVAEHGTDISAQILVLLLIIELLKIANAKKILIFDLNKIYLLISLIISLKAFYILYLIFFIYVFYLYFSNKLIKKNFFLNIYLFFSVALISIVVFTNFQNTGCLLYPISVSCFEDIPWSINLNEVSAMNKWYELWSKGGATPNYRVDNPYFYIQNFNWVNNWIKIYFFHKIADTLLGIIVISISVLIIFRITKSKKKIFNKKINCKIIYFLSIILLAEWFYIHPALRYGGYCLFAIIFFLPLSIYLERNQISFSQIKKKIVLIIIITITIFVTRNIYRIHNEILKYDFKPFSEVFYDIDESAFQIQEKYKKLILYFKNCSVNQKNICITLDKVEIGTFFKKIYFKQK